jgi:hypothetical protein
MTQIHRDLAHILDNMADALDLLTGADRDDDGAPYWYAVGVGLRGATYPGAVAAALTWENNHPGRRPPRWYATPNPDAD